MGKQKRPKRRKTNRDWLQNHLNSGSTETLLEEKPSSEGELPPSETKGLTQPLSKPKTFTDVFPVEKPKGDTFESLFAPSSTDTPNITESDVLKPQLSESQKKMQQYNQEFDELNTAIQDSMKTLDRTDEQQVTEVNKLIDMYRNKLVNFKTEFPAFNLPPEVIQKGLENNFNLPQQTIREAPENIEVDQTGGDDKEQAYNYQLLIKHLNRGLPISEIEKQSDLRGTQLGRLGGSFAQGVLSIPEGLLGMGEYLADQTGFEPARKLFENTADEIRNSIEYLSPSDPNFGEQIFSGFGSMASFMIPGLAASNIGRIAGFGKKLSQWLGIGTASMLESMTEAGIVYRETGNPTAAERTFLLNMVLITVTNRFGIQSEGSISGLRKMLASAPLEGLQEGMQRIISDRAKGIPWDKIDIAGVFEEAGIGAIVGGATGFVMPGGGDVQSDQPQQVSQVGPEGTGVEQLDDFEDIFQEFTKKSPSYVAGREQISPAETPTKAGDVIDEHPTEAQKEAGNYKKEHIRKEGFEISLENKAGSIRSGKDDAGREWNQQLGNDYGYIRGTQGRDKDHIDVFLSNNYVDDAPAFVVNQTDDKGNFDEHKVMLGFTSEQDAENAYLSNYEQGWDNYGDIVEMPMDEFKKWVENSELTKKPAQTFGETLSPEAVKKKEVTEDIKPDIKPEISEVEIEKENLPETKTDKEITKKAAKIEKEEKPEKVDEADKLTVEIPQDIKDMTDKELAAEYTRVQHKLLAAGAADVPAGVDIRSPLDKSRFERIKAEQSAREKMKQVDEASKSRLAGYKSQVEIQNLTELKENIGSGKITLPEHLKIAKEVYQKRVDAGEISSEIIESKKRRSFEKPEYERGEKVQTEFGESKYIRTFKNGKIQVRDSEGRLRTLAADQVNKTTAKEKLKKAIEQDFGKQENVIVAEVAKPEIIRKSLVTGEEDIIPIEEKTKIEQKIEKVDQDIDDTINQMLKKVTLTTGVNPEMLALSIKLNNLYIKKGFYSVQEVMQQIYQKYGEETLKKLFNAIKQGYNAFAATATDEEIDKITDAKLVRTLKVEDIITPKAAETNYTEGLKTEAEKVGLTEQKAIEVFNHPFQNRSPEEVDRLNVLLTGGLPSAGKSMIRKQLIAGGKDFANSVLVDSDENKHLLLPGQASKVHELSSLIAKKQLDKIQNENYSFIYDSQLSNYPLAKSIIEDLLNKNGTVTIGFMDIDAETSRARTVVRFLSNESDRFIPARAIVKGFNHARATFKQLFDEYKNDDRVEFIMNDVNTDNEPAKQVFRHLGETEIKDDNRFGNFNNISYVSVGKGSELRYELTEKYTEKNLEQKEAEILSRIKIGLDSRGNEFSIEQIRDRIREEEQKARGKELDDVSKSEPDTRGTDRVTEREQTEGVPEVSETEPAAGLGEQEAGSVSTAVRTDTGIKPEPASTADNRTRTPRIQRNRGNYRIKQNELNESSFSQTQRYGDNLAAIKLLKQLQKKKSKKATKAQQAILAKYVGWGGLSKVFDPYGNDYDAWQKKQVEIKELLTDDEYDAAEASTINAHFTSPTVINFMWKVAGKLGFKGGNILEPGMGVGNFFGLMPKEISDNSFLTGIELDSITAQMAQYLYPDAEINENVAEGKGFEEIFIPANSQDLVISNVPFANVQMYDATEPNSYWSKNKMSLHNFFIMKSIDKVKPGGLMMVITSHFTMDSKTLGFRQKLAEQADLIAAFKLPNTAFKGIAGTEVTTDIIILRKKDDKVPFEGKQHKWLEAVNQKLDGRMVPLNEYYLENPRDVFGTLSSKGSMYAYRGGDVGELTVEESGKLDEHIRKASNRMQSNLFTATPELRAAKKKKGKNLNAVSKNNADNYFVRDGKVYRADEEGELHEVKDIAKEEVQRFRQMSELRDNMLDSFNLQLSSSNDTAVKASVELLDEKYDQFVKKFGLLNDKQNIKFFKDDPDYSRLRALEVFDNKKKVWEKSDLLKGRVFRAAIKKTEFTGVKDVLGFVLGETGEIDLARIAELSGKPEDEVRGELLSEGAIFEDLNGEILTENEYLSGEVVAKLKAAEQAAKKDPKFKRNVAALEGVQPERVKFVDIQPTIGTNFIPGEVYSEFINDLFDSNIDITVKYVQLADRGKWIFKSDNIYSLNSSAKNTTKFGTEQFTGYDLVQKLMNNTQPTVYDTFSDGSKKINPQATELAQDKMQLIREEWTKFLTKSTEARAAVENAYNELLNTSSRRVYSGKHLTLPGVANIIGGREYRFRPYQLDFIWRMTQNRNNLADHPVGSGKTGTLIAGIMERRRLGLTKKAVYVTKKNLVGQVKREAQQLYPQAKILMPEANDFTKAERPAFLNRIKTHDWDIIVISMENYKNLSLSPEIEIDYTKQQLGELEIALESEIADAEDSEHRRKSHSQKELEKKKLRLKEKIKERQTEIDQQRKGTKRQLEYFDQLGIDYLVVDESHNYKNLYAPTSRTRVKGIGTSESQRAFDMSMKIWWMNQQEGLGVTFATGTPVSNALTEFYIIQRYLQEEKLKDKGIRSLDAWMNLFAEEQTRLEVTPEGKGMRASSRVSKLVNLPELMKLYSETTDIVTVEEVQKHFELPKIKGGKAENIEVEVSDEQIAYYESLAARMGAVRGGDVDPRVDNPLKITSEGRAVSNDIRLVMPKAADNPNSKTNVAVDYIFDIWQETKKERLAQVVFNDQGTPKAAGKKGAVSGINLYEDMKQKLIQKGVPEKEIAFIHDAKTEPQRIALYQSVNDGDVRILIGSSQKLSEGVNIQKKLYALHHINPTWKPSELTQREGRILRPGNENKEVRILRYITTGVGDVAGFDAYMYQLLENKVRGIAQASNPDTTIRSVEEAEGRALTYAEIKAIATGNPLIMEKIEIDSEVSRLERLRNEHRYQLSDAKAELSRLPGEVETAEKIVEYSKTVLPGIPTDKKVTILGSEYDVADDKIKTEAGKIITDKAAALIKAKDEGNHLIGNYGNIDVYLDIAQYTTTEGGLHQGYKAYIKMVPKNFGKYVDLYEYRKIFSKSYELASAGGVNVNRITAITEHINNELNQVKQRIEGLKNKMAGLKEEASARFPREDEYQEKLKRQKEVNKLLDVGRAAVQDEETEGEEAETEENINPKLYEALIENDIYDIKELAEITGKKPQEISSVLNDLRKQKLVEAVPGGFKPTDELKTLLNDINENPEKYEEEYGQLYSNPLPAVLRGIGRLQRSLDDAWKNLVGDKLYKGIGSILGKITPEKIKDVIITNYGLPTEYITTRREAFDSFERYQELAKQLAKQLTYRNPATGERFSDAEQKRLAQVIKGGLTSSALIRERARLAIREIKELEVLGKELETLPVETYNTKLPRKRINELLKEKAGLEKQRDKIIDNLNFPEGDLTEEQQKAQDKLTRNIDRKIEDIHSKVKNSFLHGGEGYLKRVYLTKEQTKNLRKYGYSRPTRLDLTSAIRRKDIPWEIRKQMGEILTAAYPAAKGIMLEGKDVSFGRFFEVISENPDWASETEVNGWIKLEDNPKLGKLKGMYVEPKIAGDINDVMRFTDKDEIDKFLKKVNATWKATKTVMNPSTHMRNIYSNTVLLDFSGVPHTEQIAILPDAIRAIRGTGKYAADFKASHLNNTTFTTQELGQYLDVAAENRGFMDLSLPDKLLKIYGKASLVDTKVGHFMGQVYQMEEVLGKAVKFIHERQKGKSINEARNEANKWLFDYAEIPKLIRYLRTNPIFGVPFITWTYKAFPRIIEAAITRPIAFWKYPVIFSAIAKYSLQSLGIDDDDWEKLKKELPERMLKGEWLILPFKDAANKLQMLDLTYILPYKDVYDVFASGISLISKGQFNNSDDIIDGMLGLIQAPIMKSVAELMTNKNTYNNTEIWFDVDEPQEKMLKAFDYLYKAFMPSLAPEIPAISRGGYGYHKLRSVITQREDYYGRSFTLAPAVLSSLLGMKTSPIEPEKNIERSLSKYQGRLIELATKRNRVLRDGGLSEDQRIDKALDIEKQMDEVREQIAGLKLPVKNPNIAKVESEIRKLQLEQAKIPLAKQNLRQQISKRISVLKIKLNSLMTEPDAYTGEFEKKQDKRKSRSLRKNVRKSLTKEL